MKLIWILLLSINVLGTAEDNYRIVVNDYLTNYQEIAISEMHRTGVPASIKLAQGILESDCGRSELATRANNHFGIKCGNSWQGKTFYREDDDRDHKGKLIESCFRSFQDAHYSYMAHSDFLTDKKKQYRYGFLFELDRTDYRAWAHGLKKSGYATDPSYANKLISIIEKYDLSKYDVKSTSRKSYTTTTQKKSLKTPTKTIKTKNTRLRRTSLNYAITQNNGVKAVKTRGGETLRELSKKIGVSVTDLLSFNELYRQKEDVIDGSVYVYLEKKKRKSHTDKTVHVVQKGETMQSIAQLYGIRLRSLYALNRMPRKSIIKVGETLSLHDRVSLENRPNYTRIRSRQKQEEDDLLFANDPSVR